MDFWKICVTTNLFNLQILQFCLQLMISTMTISPIAIQVPMHEIFGDNSCYFYWATLVLLSYQMIIGGFGMAIYRYGCIHNLFPPQKEPRKVAKIILISELFIIILLVSINCSGNIFNHIFVEDYW